MSGDFELLAVDRSQTESRLIVEDPTPHERTLLNLFLERARKKEWVLPSDAYSLTGRSEIPIAASVADAGALLVPSLKAGARLTAVRSVGGSITSVLGGLDTATEAEKASKKKSSDLPTPAASENAPAVAATVSRPVLCCPQPVLGPMVRSESVLSKFLTDRQRQTWRDHGYVEALGFHSRAAYRIHHREHPQAVRNGYIVYDLDAGRVLHGHDWYLPPAEEVLSFLLWLTSPWEWWVRNEASGFGTWRRTMGFPEPPGGLMFGTGDAAIFKVVGMLGGAP